MKIETFTEPVAGIYDNVMGYFDYGESARTIDDLIRSKGQGLERSVLEVGIGTGALALGLISLGYEVEGIDHSPSMLAIAREKGLSLLHQADVKDFSLGKKFGCVLSHAGPLRVDYTSQRGYFFETYLESEQEVASSVRNISSHLESGGLFVMTIQTAPGRKQEMSSTPEYQDLGEGYAATKDITEEGNTRLKERKLIRHGELVASITHRFLVLELDRFNELAMVHGLEYKGHNQTNHFYYYRKL